MLIYIKKKSILLNAKYIIIKLLSLLLSAEFPED